MAFFGKKKFQLPKIFDVSLIVKILPHGDIVADKENVSQAIFAYINENNLKFFCNFWTIFVCSNKKKLSG